MRSIVSVFATAMIFFASSAATAGVTLTVSGKILTGANAGSTDWWDPMATGLGDQIQIDIFASNVGSLVSGTMSVTGINGLAFDGGSTSSSWFNDTTNKFGAPLGGLNNLRGTSTGADGSYTSIALPRSLSNSDIINGALQFFKGVDFNSATGDGSLDFGILDGGVGPGGTPDVDFVSAGALHVRLFFTVTILQNRNFDFGVGPGDGLLYQTDSGQQTEFPVVRYVPEPGAALLMSLGLGCLAARRSA